MIQSRKRSTALLLTMALVLGLLAGCGGKNADTTAPAQTGAPATITVTDMAGREVSVPTGIDSLCVLDAFSAGIAVMLGCGESMTTTINNIKRNTLMQEICPSLADAVLVKANGDINAETMLEYQVDLAIISQETYADPDQCAKLDAIGVPYLVVIYRSMAQQREAVSLLGKALGREEAAEDYNHYYQACIDRVAEGVADIPEDQLPRIYHAVNEAVRTDYAGGLGADWTSVTRAVNVSLDTPLEMDGEKAYTTLEQIFEWDPDIVICNESGVADYVLKDSKWAGLRAVREGRVYQMPIGISRWGHDTSQEVPLALLWLAETLYPDRFDIDLEEETKGFYRELFGYELPEATLDMIFSGTGIRTEKKANSAE
jgi:iron complex transport system substrate-binding protein